MFVQILLPSGDSGESVGAPVISARRKTRAPSGVIFARHEFFRGTLYERYFPAVAALVAAVAVADTAASVPDTSDAMLPLLLCWC